MGLSWTRRGRREDKCRRAAERLSQDGGYRTPGIYEDPAVGTWILGVPAEPVSHTFESIRHQYFSARETLPVHFSPDFGTVMCGVSVRASRARALLSDLRVASHLDPVILDIEGWEGGKVSSIGTNYPRAVPLESGHEIFLYIRAYTLEPGHAFRPPVEEIDFTLIRDGSGEGHYVPLMLPRA